MAASCLFGVRFSGYSTPILRREPLAPLKRFPNRWPPTRPRSPGELAHERQRAEKQAADFAERDARSLAELAAERARTEKAIAAFASLAERLDALAAARERRPWWRRLVG